jgi:toxin ParE1/3/4
MKRLVLSTSARSDLINIRKYIATDNKEAAARIIREIKARLETLVRFPELGRRRDELKKGMRSFAIAQLRNKEVRGVLFRHRE